MQEGYFFVRTYVYNEASPIENAVAYVKIGTREGTDENGNVKPYDANLDASPQNYDYSLVTGSDGRSEIIRIEAPDMQYSFVQGGVEIPYSLVDVYVEADGFVPVLVRGLQVFPSIQSELPLALEPNVSALPVGDVRVYNVPANAVVSSPERTPEFPNSSDIQVDVLPEIVIPSNIVVHLGRPDDSSAANVTVPFTEYIKNVASSEIFPTWDEEAIRANIYAQISLALNRVYTEWYPSRGYPFQITNSTAFDQAFVRDRNIFENISTIVDEIFNRFIRRQGNYEPLFAQYCDGIRTSCNGMSQWGSQNLAEQGYSALDILKYYYGDDIQITMTDNIADETVSYPGRPLSLGSVGEDVLRIQIELNRIRQDYPLIPRIEEVNGRFGTETEEAVRTFQDIFNLETDGIVGMATWYKISRIYTAVTDLAEISSEGTGTRIPDEIPNVTLSIGSQGPEVRLLQYILEYLSYFYPTIPQLSVDGYFGQSTENSVIGFQKTFGITADGVVGEETWEKLYAAANEISEAVAVSDEQRYSGTPLNVGSTGRRVELMKMYYNRIAQYYGNLPQVTQNDVYDEEFANAITAFQERYGLEADGIIGALTWTRIVELYNFIENEQGGTAPVFAQKKTNSFEKYPGIPIRRGMNGRHIKFIQNAINVINKHSDIKKYLNVNGEYGSETEMSVKTYQKKNGFYPNGIVDERLWNKMMSEAENLEKNI